MMCRNTRRADQRAPGSNHGASGSGVGGVEVGSVATSSSVRRADLLVVGQHAGQGLAGLQVPVPAPRVGAPVAVHRLGAALGEAAPSPPRSPATCLIRPARFSALTVGPLRGLLVGEARGR